MSFSGTGTLGSPLQRVTGTVMPASILIVEDEPAIRDLLAVNLRHDGYRPVLAADAGEARRRIDA